ncbi:MAG: hypothetical protein QOH71_3911 [Blastocatellia bacterium]|jgi:hypothetical protein|nr:hypothetical protein [Blastocatellia bacterium]
MLLKPVQDGIPGSDRITGENRRIAGLTPISDIFWLCHTDARQVSDLPTKASLYLAVYDRRVGDPKKKGLGFRQVTDLPRIGVAEPSG